MNKSIFFTSRRKAWENSLGEQLGMCDICPHDEHEGGLCLEHYGQWIYAKLEEQQGDCQAICMTTAQRKGPQIELGPGVTYMNRLHSPLFQMTFARHVVAATPAPAPAPAPAAPATEQILQVLNFALAEPCKECGMSMKCICLKKQTHHEQPSIELEWNGLKDIGWMEEEMSASKDQDSESIQCTSSKMSTMLSSDSVAACRSSSR